MHDVTQTIRTPIARAFQTVLTALVLTTLSTLADACPTCRTSLAEGGHWAHGFALSIAVLLGVLFLAGGTFGLAVWRATRNAD
jgi:hypothetical protein